MKIQEIQDFLEAAEPDLDGKVFVSIDGAPVAVRGITFAAGKLTFETRAFTKRARKKAIVKKKARKK